MNKSSYARETGSGSNTGFSEPLYIPLRELSYDIILRFVNHSYHSECSRLAFNNRTGAKTLQKLQVFEPLYFHGHLETRLSFFFWGKYSMSEVLVLYSINLSQSFVWSLYSIELWAHEQSKPCRNVSFSCHIKSPGFGRGDTLVEQESHIFVWVLLQQITS